jgi:hypothetical protein
MSHGFVAVVALVADHLQRLELDLLIRGCASSLGKVDARRGTVS